LDKIYVGKFVVISADDFFSELKFSQIDVNKQEHKLAMFEFAGGLHNLQKTLGKLVTGIFRKN
jgi:hypothetical protein